MSINFDVLIDSSEYAIDMKSGLETLQGVSDATRTIAETVLTDRVVKRKSHKSKVRTNLKQTFKGSYGHIYSLEIYDDLLKKKFNRIGKETFSELMTYYICQSLYLENEELSPKAEKIIEKLGVNSDKLIQELRVSSLENIHEISTKFNQEVELNFRKSRNKRNTIAKFNKKTAKALEAVESSEKMKVVACITRFNIFTGNGRLLLEDEGETVAFGFKMRYSQIRLDAKKAFSENLDQNNGVSGEKRSYLKLQVQPVKLRDGKIVKYMVTGIYND